MKTQITRFTFYSRLVCALLLAVTTTFSALPTRADEPTRRWEDLLTDILTGTGPTFPTQHRPRRATKLEATAVSSLRERTEVKGINVGRFGSPRWDKGAWLEYPKGKSLIIVPLKNVVTGTAATTQRETSYALFILKRGPGRELNANNSCIAIVAADTVQTSASAAPRQSLRFMNADGATFVTGKLTGKRLSFERSGKNQLFAAKPCPQADDGIGDCIWDADVPDILEPPCAIHFLLCGAVIVADCIGNHW